MKGGDIREIARNATNTELVVYEDKDGNIHEMFGARRVCADGVPYLIFSESYLGFEFKLDRHPNESLANRLNEYNDQILR